MGVLGWILFGFVVGLIARAIMPGRDPLGLIGTTVLGIVGALVAGWAGQALGIYAPDDGAGFVAATLGAVVVLAVYYVVTGRRRLAGSIDRPQSTINTPVNSIPGSPVDTDVEEKNKIDKSGRAA